MEVSQCGSLPTHVPRWLARRPYAAAQLLRWRNRCRLQPGQVLGIAALCVAAGVGVLAAPRTGVVLRWLAASPLVTLAIAACLFGLCAVRRNERLRSDEATSWLAALPVPGAAIPRLIWATGMPLVAVVLWLALACGAGTIGMAAAQRLVALAAAGALVGTVAGAWSSRGSGPPHPWHYARVLRARPRWATAPSLLPLSHWPLAQGRVFSRPAASRVVLFALLAVPAGRRDPGQVALAVAAGCITAFALLSLSTAAVRAAGDAARWLAPTTVRLRTFIAVFLWQVALKQAAMLAVVIFLACAVDYREALRVGGVLAVSYVALSSAIAALSCVRGARRTGLGSVSRGA